MPDILDSNGLQIAPFTETVDNISAGFITIYGSDINLNSNSPDAQMINIFAKGATDVREVSQGIYNSYDPDQAQGVVLDQRVVINNLFREQGTFTIVPIDVTADRTVSVNGLDSLANDPNGAGFTISDNQGNQYILLNTTTFNAGLTSAEFRASNSGQVLTTVNTIVNIDTPILGITSVNNSAGALQIGQDEETDFQLRTRRSNSTAINSQAGIDGLRSALGQLTGVEQSVVYENVNDSVDVKGVPGHGIWVIVLGGASTDIANAIYTYHSMGTNMKGSISVNVPTLDGDTFIAKYDVPISEPLYIKCNLKQLNPNISFATSAITNYVQNNLSYNIGESAETSKVTVALLNAINYTSGVNSGVPLDVFISNDGITWTDYLTTASYGGEWTISSINITITVES